MGDRFRKNPDFLSITKTLVITSTWVAKVGFTNTFCRLSLALVSLAMAITIFAAIVLCTRRLATAEIVNTEAHPCSLPGSQRLARELQVHSTCEGDGGEVTTIPMHSCVLVSEQPNTCALPLVALRFQKQWFFADSVLLQGSIECDEFCERNREKRADRLAMSCLRGELTACKTLREEERVAAAVRLDAIKAARAVTADAGPSMDSSILKGVDIHADGSPDVMVDSGATLAIAHGDSGINDENGAEDTLQAVDIITKMSCALKSEPNLYGSILTRLVKGQKCHKVGEEIPYFRVLCGDDSGWAVESCFHGHR